jgi:hypothetical protein
MAFYPAEYPVGYTANTTTQKELLEEQKTLLESRLDIISKQLDSLSDTD